MISEKRLLAMMEKRCVDANECAPVYGATYADGYSGCYNDFMECVEILAKEQRIKASARRSVRKLLGR